MKKRQFGNTGQQVSEIGLGCWQLGADWGDVSDDAATAILSSAVDAGVTFLDTADVYGDGRSERLVGEFLKTRSEDLFVATKVGRRNYPGPYTKESLREHINDCRKRLGVSALDLVQLHCIPTGVMADGRVFEWLRSFQKEGLIQHFGASVESVAEAELIIEQEGLTSLQIIFNLFRHKPASTLFDKAQERGVGIIVRLPLASGLLSGKFTAETVFGEQDHRNYNRDGAMFNVGETFAGLPFYKGISLAEQLREQIPAGLTMAQFAQRWILDHDAVSAVITGASRPEQARQNATVSDLPELSSELRTAISVWYQAEVHDQIRGVY